LDDPKFCCSSLWARVAAVNEQPPPFAHRADILIGRERLDAALIVMNNAFKRPVNEPIWYANVNVPVAAPQSVLFRLLSCNSSGLANARFIFLRHHAGVRRENYLHAHIADH